MKRNFVKGSTIMFDESLREKILPIPEPWSYDWYISFVALLTSNVADINKELHKYRRHNNQASAHNTNSRLKKIIRGIKASSPPSYFEQRATQWQMLKQTINQFDTGELNLDRGFILKHINDRHQYEHHRKIAHDPKVNISRKFKCIYDNYESKRYQRYGDLPDILFLVRDSIAALKSSSRF
jgi:hypothetical protein